MDPQSKIMMSNETLSRMDQAKTEYAWDSEKQSLALAKLQNMLEMREFYCHTFIFLFILLTGSNLKWIVTHSRSSV